MLCGVEPLAGEIVSHEESLEAVHPKLPYPPLVIATDCAGAVCPFTAEKLRLRGETTSAGGCATTLKLTEIVVGLLPAPGAVTVTTPL
jgi:hypothetical protein